MADNPEQGQGFPIFEWQDTPAAPVEATAQGPIINSRKSLRTRLGAAGFIVVTGGLVASTFVMDGGSQAPRGEAEPATTELNPDDYQTIADAPPIQPLSGTVEDGSDAAIAAEVALDVYQCGGLKNELWSDKPFNSNHLLQYMNSNKELAEDDEAFWRSVMGDEGFSFLVANAAENAETDTSLEIEGQDEYTQFIQKQIGTRDHSAEVTENYMCAGKKVSFYNHKNVKNALLTGLIVTPEVYEEWVEIAKREGRDVSRVITSFLKIDADIDGDGEIAEGGETVVHLATKHGICANNELNGEIPDKPVTTTTEGQTTTTSVIRTTTTMPIIRPTTTTSTPMTIVERTTTTRRNTPTTRPPRRTTTTQPTTSSTARPGARPVPGENTTTVPPSQETPRDPTTSTTAAPTTSSTRPAEGTTTTAPETGRTNTTVNND